MRTNVLLVCSVLLNLLLGFYALRPARPPATRPITQSEMSPAKRERASAEPSPGQTVTNTVVKRFNWESVESPDYKQYIANLRAVGCPEETIRDIILADVNKLYDQKKKAARGPAKKFEYWKGGNPFFAMAANAELNDKLRALDEERNNVLRALDIEPDFRSQAAQMINPLEAMFDFLPENKKVSFLKLMTDMQGKMAKAMEGGGQPEPAEIAKAQKEMEQAVKQMLTPEEALEYDLRMSMTANIMRNQIAGFDPSEEEFLKVFHLRKGFDDDFNPMLRGNETEAERQRREGAEKDLKEKIKQTLGPERYAAYERSQDWAYQQIYSATKRADLGTAEANQVYEMKKTAEDETRKIRSNTNLTEEQRNEALKAVRQETEKSLQNVLGQKGWDHYNRPNNIHWLDNMHRPPPAPKPVQQP